MTTSAYRISKKYTLLLIKMAARAALDAGPVGSESNAETFNKLIAAAVEDEGSDYFRLRIKALIEEQQRSI